MGRHRAGAGPDADELRARVLDDLRGSIEGELLFDPVARAPYAIDASLYEIDPLGVVVPRVWDDVRAVLRYAAEDGLAIHPRGAGTGLAGESLGRGLILDLGRSFRAIKEIGHDSVVVEPGIALDDLNRALEPHGRRLGPDPSGSDSGTIGGLIAGNAAGARSLKYGTMADCVRRLRLILPHGEDVEFARSHPIRDQDAEAPGLADEMARKVAFLVNQNADLIARGYPHAPRDRAGYALRDVLGPEGVDLARLIIGSEGTLAIIAEAELATVPLPAARGVALLGFVGLIDAAAAVGMCLRERPAACELHDWRALSLLREHDPWYRGWLPEAAEAVLVVEFEEGDEDEVRAKLSALLRRLGRHPGIAASPRTTLEPDECDRLMSLRRVALPQLLRRSGPSYAVPIIEDVAVPVEGLSGFLQDLQLTFKRLRLNSIVYGHAGHGQLHIRPFLDMADPDDLAKLSAMAAEVYEAAWKRGGTISGEHGCGLSRSQFLPRQSGELVKVFRAVKELFDPQGILNPGKVLNDDPGLIAKDLRKPARSAPGGGLAILEPALAWPGDGLVAELDACNGCGACRSRDPALRMCPSFRATEQEAATPRAQVQLLRQIASGVLDPRTWGGEELRKNAGLCVHCLLCRDECPAGVDVSSLMVEAKAAFVRDHGLSLSDWSLSRLEVWTRWAGRFPRLVNHILRGPRWRWLLEKAAGLSRFRSLPTVAREPFLSKARRMGLTRPHPESSGPRVAYFVDIFANVYDPELAESAVSVLARCGVNVFVPPRQRGSGMAALIVGDVDYAREIAAYNLRALAGAVRDGYVVACTEPTAAVMLKQEYPRLVDGPDARAVADATMEFGELLAALDARGLVPPFTEGVPARAGYHQPCHLRALKVGTPGLDLLRRIPGLEIEFIDRGCSGMAGTSGLSRRNFRMSLRAGRGLRTRLRDPDLEFGATECGACRMQMEQGLAKRTVHPAKLLAAAYGLNPTLRQRLKQAKDRREIG